MHKYKKHPAWVVKNRSQEELVGSRVGKGNTRMEMNGMEEMRCWQDVPLPSRTTLRCWGSGKLTTFWLSVTRQLMLLVLYIYAHYYNECDMASTYRGLLVSYCTLNTILEDTQENKYL